MPADAAAPHRLRRRLARFRRHAERRTGRCSVRPTRRRTAHVVVVIEAEIDDMNPQMFGVLMDRLLADGRAGRVLHADSDEEEPAGHAPDDRRAAARCARG